MNHEILFRDLGGRVIRVAVTGAKGAFSRSLLVQLRAIPRFRVAALCDLDAEGVLDLLAELGHPAEAATACASAAEARGAAEAGRVAVLRDAALLAAVPHDILVEATGQPEFGARVSVEAIERGVHRSIAAWSTPRRMATSPAT